MHYFDNAATSWPKPETVYSAVEHVMRHNGASPGRSGHCLAKELDAMVEDTRELLAAFFNAPDPRQVAFTFNGTDGLNMVIKGLLKPGDHAITSTVEHNSVSRPLRTLADVEITYAQANEDGLVDPAQLRELFQPNTKLVIMCHASNVLGGIQDVSALSQTAHQHRALFALDAAQTAGAIPIDMQAMGVDILIVPGHKSLLGPYGTGAVITLRDVGLAPWRDGGTGIRSEARLHPEELPHRLEGGTLNASGIAGLKAAVEFIKYSGVETIRQAEATHVRRIIEILERFDNTTIYGTKDARRRAGLVSFNVAGLASEDLAIRMNDEFKIAGRPGLHCAPMAHRTVHTYPQGSYRLSPGFFTTERDMEALDNALEAICCETR